MQQNIQIELDLSPGTIADPRAPSARIITRTPDLIANRLLNLLRKPGSLGMVGQELPCPTAPDTWGFY